MATFQLMLTRIKCITDTSEGGADSPYLIVFIGRRGPSPSCKVLRVRSPAWDETFTAGKAVNTQQIVDQADITDAVVLAALIEEDWDPDLGSGGVLQTLAQVHWKNYGGNSWANLNNAQVADLMCTKFAGLVKAALDNDEYLRTKVVPIRKPLLEGPISPTLSYVGDDGRYDVTFSIRKKGD